MGIRARRQALAHIHPGLSAVQMSNFVGFALDAAQVYCEARVRGALEIDALFLDGAGHPLGRSERMRKDKNRW